MRIAVTGATGFVGHALAVHLEAMGDTVDRLGRAELATPRLAEKLADCDALVHTAGLAHTRNATAEDFETVNHQLAVRVAETARAAGVRRFVFVSTMNVLRPREGVLSPRDPVAPTTPYGMAKARAEAALLGLHGIEMVVVRPPLVYGAGARGNARRLAQLSCSHVPLPFGRVNNRRTMVGISNLVSALSFLARADAAQVAGKIFHSTDTRDLSLKEMVATMRQGVGLPARLVPFPVGLMRLGLGMLGRGAIGAQLLSDLRVDGSDLVRAGWSPMAIESADLVAMARALRAERAS